MKYSRTALRELTRLYRVALLAAIMGTVALSGTAKASPVEGTVVGTYGTATIFNESDGGGIMFTNTSDNVTSFVGVHDGVTEGFTHRAQIYAVDTTSDDKVGARLNVTENGMYYTVGAKSAATNTAENELVTVGTVASKATYDASATYGAGTIGKAISDKQDALTTAQLAAVNSGITADKVTAYDGYADAIAGKQATLTEAQLNAANSGITAAKVSTYDGYATGKQDALTTAQLAAVNSGITADKVTAYDGYADAIAGKQATLTEAQLNAANSGITAAKVSTYDGYADAIAGKQDTLTTAQLAAVNSGITGMAGDVTITDESTVSTTEAMSTKAFQNSIQNLFDNVSIEWTEEQAFAGGFTVGDPSDGYGIDDDGKATLADVTTDSLTIGTQAATAIQTGKITAGDNNTLATTAAVFATTGTIDGLVTSATATKTSTGADYFGNLAIGTTVEQHLEALDAAIGNRSAYTEENYIANGQAVGASLDALDMAIADRTVAVNTTTGIATISDGTTTAEVYTTTQSDAKYVQASENNTFTGNNTFQGTVTAENGLSVTGGTLSTTGNATIGGNETVGGTLGVTGALNGSTATFSGAVNSVGLNAGAGAIATTGTLAAGASTLGSLTVTNNATVGGTLNAGATTVSSLTSTGAVSGTTGTFTGAVASNGLNAGSGKIETSGSLEAGDLKTVGQARIGGNLTVDGTSTLTGLATFTNGINVGSKTVTAIETAAVASDGGKTDTLATTASVLLSAQNGAYSNTVKGSAASTTLKDALDKSISTLNNVLIADGSKVDSAKVDVLWNGSNSTLNTVLGNGIYTSPKNLTAGSSVTTALTALDDAIGSRASLGSANAAINTGIATSVAAGLKAAGDAIGDLQYTAPTAVSYGALTANTDLTTVAAQTAYNIGAAVTGTNGNVLAANTVNANLDKIDTNMGNLTTMAHNAFGGTPANITAGVNALATNVATGMGGTFATDGSWSGSVVTTSGVDYTYGSSTTTPTPSTNLLAAISQVASNVGTATTTTANGVAAGQTVNANIDAINTAVGHIAGVANAKGNVAGADVATKLDAIDVAIGDRTNYTKQNHIANNQDVATSLDALDTALGDLQYSSTQYVNSGDDVTAAVSSLDHNVASIEYDLGRLENEVRGGFAAAAAMSALVPNARAAGDTQIAVGTGNYRDRVGFAVGAFHYVNDNILVNAGAAYGGSKSTTFRAGVTFGW